MNPVVQDLELLSLIGFDGNPPNGLVVHPDGVHIVYSLGTNVTTYNWATKKQRFFTGLSNTISALALSPCGKFVAAGQANFMNLRSPIVAWNFDTGLPVARYEAHTMRIESLSFSSCGNYLMSLGGQDDGSIVVYDIGHSQMLSTTTSVRSTAGNSTVLRALHTRPDLLIVAGENMFRLWTVHKEQRSMSGQDAAFAKIKRNILCVAIDRADEYVYCGTSTGDMLKIKLHRAVPDAGTSTPPQPPSLVGCYGKHPARKNRGGATVDLYSKGITSLLLIEDQCDTIVLGTGDGLVELVMQKPPKACKKHGDGGDGNSDGVRLITPTSPLLVPVKSVDVQSHVTSVQLMGDVILVGTAGCELFTVDAVHFHAVRMFTCHTSAVFDLAFPRDYSRVFATTSVEDVRVWSVDTLQELLRITVRNRLCSGAVFAYDGSQIVTAWNDGRIRAFTPETGRQLYVLNNCHNRGVSAIAVSMDLTRLISGGGDGQVRVWSVDVEKSSGKLLAVLKEHKGRVSSIEVHRLGHEAVSASSDGTCVVWDIVRFARLSIMFSTTVFTDAKYHPNGVQLITCGTNRLIGYWEVLDGTLVREIEGSTASALNSLDVTPAGKYFVTGAVDQMVKVWLYNEGVPTHVGLGHAGTVTNVRVSPDGRFIVSTSSDGGIFVWRFPHEPDLLPADQDDARSSDAVSVREQQTDRSRQLSLKKKLPARKENIKRISKVQKIRADSSGSATANDGQVTSDGGSVKCLCPQGTKCKCGDEDINNVSRGSQMSKSSAR